MWTPPRLTEDAFDVFGLSSPTDACSRCVWKHCVFQLPTELVIAIPPDSLNKSADFKSYWLRRNFVKQLLQIQYNTLRCFFSCKKCQFSKTLMYPPVCFNVLSAENSKRYLIKATSFMPKESPQTPPRKHCILRLVASRETSWTSWDPVYNRFLTIWDFLSTWQTYVKIFLSLC